MYLVPLDPIPKRFRIPADAEGRVRGGGWTRQKLYLWPLSDDRASLEAPILGRHCKAEFGPAPSGSMWRADHPSSTTVQLADGNWHNVMGYRIHDDVESHELPSPPQTGAYLEEVISAGRTDSHLEILNHAAVCPVAGSDPRFRGIRGPWDTEATQGG